MRALHRGRLPMLRIESWSCVRRRMFGCGGAAVVVVVAAGVLSGALVVEREAAAESCPAVRANGNWAAIDAKKAFSQLTPSANPQIHTYTATNGSIFAVQNGRILWRSTNGGCDWKVVYSLGAPEHVEASPAALMHTGGYQIARVATFAGSRTQRSRVYVFIYDKFQNLTLGGYPYNPVFVGVSNDNGDHWAFRSPQGSPQPEDPGFVASSRSAWMTVSPRDPDTLYVYAGSNASLFANEPTVNAHTGLFVSRDAGVTWSQIPRDGLPFAGQYWSGCDGFECSGFFGAFADAKEAKVLWHPEVSELPAKPGTEPAGVSVTVWRSGDGGRKWAKVLRPMTMRYVHGKSGPAMAGWVASADPVGRSGAFSVWCKRCGAFVTSTDGGRHWRQTTFPRLNREAGVVDGLIYDARRSRYVAFLGYGSSGQTKVAWRYDPERRRWVGLPAIISPYGVGNVLFSGRYDAVHGWPYLQGGGSEGYAEAFLLRYTGRR